MSEREPAALDPEAARLVEALGLAPHPEGGFYRETYRSPVRVPTPRGERSAVTAILFLLPAGATSAFHRVRSDELWIHSAGGASALHLVAPDGAHRVVTLGAGTHVPVPAGHWQAARPDGPIYTLATCVVAPGFDFADFELARRGQLQRAHPALPASVLTLARE